MQTEQEMRGSTIPKHQNVAELSEYIESLVKREHDYGTCVYAMSMAAVAAFNYVAHELGVTGFQASCADMDILRRTRSLAGPAMLLDGENLLYPQYDLQKRVADWIANCGPWLAEEATKKLADSPGAHPQIIEHWQRLALKMTT